ncbi:lipopolysaccharide biosynthesis protein [Rhabdothermincola sp.]|uniref:lipopolysaccharide biosynthesis protein n=1 Tax=Rhabdothermincola sp. TaxID=2820405 RepID=UPI002FE2DCE2
MTAAANVTLAGLNAASGVLLARSLGPAGRGEVAAIQLWGFLLATVAVLGTTDAVVYFSARRPERAGTFATSAAVLTTLTALPVVAVGWVAMPLLLASQSSATVGLARLFLLFVPLYAVANQPGQALRGLSSFTRWNVVRLLPSLLWVVVVVSAIATGNRSPGFVTVGFLCGWVLSFGVSVVVARPIVRPPYRVDVTSWGPMLRYGLPLMLASIPQWLNVRLDQLLLAAFVPSDELGLYVVAVAWAGLVTPLVNALGVVLFPRLAAEPDEQTREQVLFLGIRVTVLVTAGLVFAVGGLTPLAVPLFFGGAFSAAIGPAAILVAGSGLLATNFVLEEGFRGLGRPGDVLRAELGGLAATAVLLAGLLPGLGILGAALASLGGYLATTLLLLHGLRRTVTGGVLRRCVPRRQDVRELVAGVVSLARLRPAQG